MTTTFRAALTLAVLAGSACAAQAQSSVKLEGRCERLVIAGLDITKTCKESLTNMVVGNRTSFDFAASDGQTLSFSGNGARQEGTEMTEPLQPINLVTPGQSSKDSIARSPAPAVGSCKFTTPEPGKSEITCEATSQGKAYAGTFVTEVKPAQGTEPKPAAKP